MKLHLAFLVAFTMLVQPTSPAVAGGEGGNYGTKASGLSNATTNRVVRTLTRGVKSCQRLERVYRYDCYRNTYAVAANQLNNIPEYAAARSVIVEVENALARTIARNEDSTAPRKRRGGTVFRPIKESALPRAKGEFVTALNRAETKLLRSSSNSGDHFIRIAQAINTNKVLLRSALLFSPSTSWIAIAVNSAPLFRDKTMRAS